MQLQCKNIILEGLLHTLVHMGTATLASLQKDDSMGLSSHTSILLEGCLFGSLPNGKQWVETAL